MKSIKEGLPLVSGLKEIFGDIIVWSRESAGDSGSSALWVFGVLFWNKHVRKNFACEKIRSIYLAAAVSDSSKSPHQLELFERRLRLSSIVLKWARDLQLILFLKSVNWDNWQINRKPSSSKFVLCPDQTLTQFLCLPASFFNLFSLARLFWNQTCTTRMSSPVSVLSWILG